MKKIIFYTPIILLFCTSFKFLTTKKVLSKVVVTEFMQSLDPDENFGGNGKSDLYVKILSNNDIIYQAKNVYQDVSCCPCHCEFIPQNEHILNSGATYTLELWDKDVLGDDKLHAVQFAIDNTDAVNLFGIPLNPTGSTEVSQTVQSGNNYGAFKATIYWNNVAQ